MIKFMPGRQCFFNKIFFYYIILSVVSLLLFSSCSTVKNSYYFKTIKKDTSISHFISASFDLKIQKKDELTILVSSLNREEDAIYNSSSNIVGATGITGGAAGGGSGSSSSSSTGSSGTSGPGTYPVDSLGNIQIHRLGIVHAEGMTLTELKTKLENDLLPYLRDPIISIGFANHKVTVLGDVRSPQILLIPQNTLTLLEALTKCGDADIDASKNNILLIRDSANIKLFKHIDLENISVFNTSYYYLQPGDIVYVSPNVEKIERDTRRVNTQFIISIAASVLSIIVILLDQSIK